MTREAVTGVTDQGSHEQSREFKPAFTPDSEVGRPAPVAPETATRSVGKFALGELHEELPQVEWKVVEKLVRRPRERMGLFRQEMIEDFAPLAVTKLASAIAHKADPDIPFTPPTIEQVKESNSLISFVSYILHSLPFGLGDALGGWFDSMFVRRTSKFISREASRLLGLIDALKSVKKPKKQFVDELEAFYEHIKSRIEESGDSKNGLVNTVRAVYGRQDVGKDQQPQSWYDPSEYPLTSEVLVRLLPTPEVAKGAAINKPVLSQRALVRFVTPEIMRGVEVFLQGQGREVESIQYGSNPSLPRRAAEKFSYTRNKLESVVGLVTTTLQDAHNALPEDGESFVSGVVDLSKKIVKLMDLGHTGQEIVDKLRKDIWPKRRIGF